MSSNWETVKLGDVTKFQQGKQIELEDQFLEPTNEMLRFVRIIDYTSENEPSRYIKADKKSSSYVTDEDVVMIRYGSQTAGKVVIGKAGIIANNMFRVIPTVSYLDRKYLYFYLKTPSVYSYLRGGQSSSTMPAITFGLMSSLDIKIPPLPTQKKIAHILSTLDDKIELNRKMNQTLEAMASAIFKSWFVDFDPVHAKLTCKDENDLETIAKKLGVSKAILDLFPSEFEESELGMIPKGWNLGSIYEIIDVIYGAPFSSSNFNDQQKGKPLIRIRDLKTFNSQHWTEEIHPKGTLITAGDLLIGMDAEFTPTIWQGINGWLNQRVCKIEPKNGSYTAFNYFILKPKMEFFEKSNVGTTVIHLGKKDIDTIELLIPPEELLNASKNIIEPLFDKLVQNSLEIRELQKTRDTLLPKLLSGEIDVSELEIK